MTIEEMSGEVDVWPDNMDALNVFMAFSTQWRTGVNGPTGLDYSVFPIILRMCNIARGGWPEMFREIRVMERAALDRMHHKP